MISVIVCCRSSESTFVIRNNITKTVGCQHEIISIDNSQNKHSIPEAYNIGLAQSKYNNLVFCHDDILFKDDHWGHKVAIHLSKPDIGVIGFAGGTYFSNAPSTWWSPSPCNNLVLNHLQKRTIDHQSLKKQIVELDKENSPNILNEVICLDGFAMMFSKSKLPNFKWDQIIGKWHGYDLDLCLYSKSQKLKNYVCSDILVQHNSLGKTDEKWGHAIINIWRKYALDLPYSCNMELNNDYQNVSYSIDSLKTFIYWTHKSRSLRRPLISNIFLITKMSHMYRILLCAIIFLSYSTNNLLRKVGHKGLDRLSLWYQ